MNVTPDNKMAIYNVLKGLLVAGGPLALLLTRVFGMDDGTVRVVIEASSSVLSVVGLVWLGVSGTDANVAVSASEVRGLQVHVNTRTANQSLVSLAKDAGVPDLVPMIGGPRHDSNKDVSEPPPNDASEVPPTDSGYKTLRG